MKKTSIAILFTILITAACLFASCNGYGTDSGGDPNESDSYESAIRALENQILQLQRDQFISNAERNEQILKLEGMINQLKEQSSTSPSPNESESESGNEESESSTESESESESESEAKSEFLYTIADGAASITGYTGDDTHLTLPSQIDGYDVIAISDEAFANLSLNTVIIPNTVTKIGWFAFKGCESLHSVTIPDSVSAIGYDAFPRSTQLTIVCSRDSFAARYAESYGINTALI